MPITEDASTPAIVTGDGTGDLVSASFSPPGATLLLALVAAGYANNPTVPDIALSDSLGGSWTAGPTVGSTAAPFFGRVSIFWRYVVSAPGSMTVTAAFTNHLGGRFLAPIVLNGAAANQTGAGSATRTMTVDSTDWTLSFTTTTTGSVVYGLFDDPQKSSAFTAAANTTLVGSIYNDTTDGITAGAGKSTSATGTPGAVTLGFTDPVVDVGVIAFLEILPAAVVTPQAGQPIEIPRIPATMPGSLGMFTQMRPWGSTDLNADVRGAIAGSLQPIARQLLNDTFSGYPVATWVEGEEHGNWAVEPSGNQTVEIVDVSGNRFLDVASEAVGGGGGSFASLVLSSREYKKWSRLVVEYATTAQYRTPTPFDWECAWVLWNFESVNHFYYFILKPNNGWELGKEWHNGTSQQQDFLDFSFSGSWPVGNRLRVIVDQVVSGASVTITVTIEDLTAGTGPVVVTTVTDDGTRASGPAYPAGKVGLYTEDSKGRYDLVTLDDKAALVGTSTDRSILAGTVAVVTADLNGSSKATAALAGTVSGVTADLNGTAKSSAVLAGTLHSITGAIAATGKDNASLAGSLGPIAGDLNGTSTGGTDNGILAGTVQNVTADLNGTARQTGTLAGTVQNVIADLNGTAKASGPLAGTVPGVTADLNGTAKSTGTLAGTVQGVTADLNGIARQTGILAGGLHVVTADLNGVSKDAAVLAGVLSLLEADLNGASKASGPLAGTVTKVTGKFYPRNLDDPSDMMVFFHSTYGLHSYSRNP